jgi:adenine-specific DNA glycosylase
LRHLFSVRHSYTRFRVTLDVWRCDAQPLPREDKTHKWLDPGMVKRYPMPSATIKIFEKLKGSETPLTS